MGWWSCSIMGGDSPLDYYGDIWGQCGVKYDGDNHAALTKKHLDDHLPKLTVWAARQTDPVAWQALAVTIMERGGKMPALMKRKIVKAAESDEWMKEEGRESKRGRNVLAFIAKVKAYKGEPVDCKQEEGLMSRGGGTSLFENLEQHLAEGKTGLINKNT